MLGTSRRVVPVRRRIPNPAAMTSSGADSQTVSPLVSGPPTTYPTNPAPLERPVESVGEPEMMCQRPSAGRPTSNDPMISRGRISGLGSVRISRIARPTPTMGSTAEAAPKIARTRVSMPPPIGPPALNQTPPAMTTLNAIRPSAIPSRRWPASISPTLLTVRVVAPTPRAARDHPAPIPFPTAANGLAR